MENFDNYFKRQIELWGKQTQLQLQKKKIVIIGCGGLGCSIAISLGSSGIGQIDLIDFDTVAFHNIHRQIGFTMQDIGKSKSKTLEKLLLSKSSYTKINSFNVDFLTFITQTNTQYDLIIDATDNLEVRREISKFAQNTNTPWIYGSVEEFHGQVCFFEQACFESVFNINNHTPLGIAAPIVVNIASLQANLALRYLANLEIKKDFLYYCFFNQEGVFQIQNFKLPSS